MNDVKDVILYDSLQLKLEQNPLFKEILLESERPLHHTVITEEWGKIEHEGINFENF